MKRWARQSRLLAGLAAGAALLAACSGGVTRVSDTTSAPATTQPPVTTSAPTTTTEGQVVVLPTPTTQATTTITAAPTTTTTEAPVLAQLTGQPVVEPLARPVAVVKIDNHHNAVPQWGLHAADVVFEEIVEGGITRFAAAYHSQESFKIGPVRSARTGDFDLLTNLNRPLLVTSGANATVWRLLSSVDTVVITDGGSIGVGALSRTTERAAPHNLITSTKAIYESIGDAGRTPPPLFTFGDPGSTPAGGQSVAGVDIDFGSIDVSYRWDATLNGWARSQRGKAHHSDDRQIAPDNVVIQFVTYHQSVADRVTPEAKLLGSGEAIVLVGGQAVEGTWQRGDETSVTELRDSNGAVIELRPGTTWVALARSGTAELVAE